MKSSGGLPVGLGRKNDRLAVRGETGREDSCAAIRELPKVRRRCVSSLKPSAEPVGRADRREDCRGGRPAPGASPRPRTRNRSGLLRGLHLGVEGKANVTNRLEAIPRLLLEAPGDDSHESRRSLRIDLEELREDPPPESGSGSRPARLPGRPAAPTSISYSTAPNEKMSERRSAGSPRTCSGAMYPTVPSTAPTPLIAVAVGAAVRSSRSSSGCVSLARPKSRILTTPSLVRKRFSGFRSR